MDLDENDLYGSGLNRTDWYMLRDAILCASWTSDNQSKDFERLPKHLQEHAIGQIVANSLAGLPNGNLDVAAKLMVNGADKAWLILEKS